MGHRAHLKKLAAGIGIVTALSVSTIVPAFADDSGVAQEITAGTLDVTVPATLGFTSATTAYSHAAHTVTSNTFQIEVDDSTGSGTGWHVSMSVSDLVAGAETIDASLIELASAANLTSTAGQNTTGITAATPGAGLALDTGVTVLDAAALSGQGTYTLDTTIDINIPAFQHAGAYTGTLTTDLTSGPDA